MTAISLLARRYLRREPARYLLTTAAVTAAAALLVGSGIIMESVRTQMVRSIVRTHGNYHVAWKGIPAEAAELLGRQLEVEEWGYLHREEIRPEGGAGPLTVRRVGGAAAEILGIGERIVEGRFPQAPDELLIDAATARELSLRRSGAILTNEFTDGAYRITGIFSQPVYRSAAPARTVYGVAAELSRLGDTPVDLYLRLADPRNVAEFTAGINYRIGLALPSAVRNESLLNILGVGADRTIAAAMRRFTALVVIIITAAAAAVICNIFSISAASRMRHLGMLQALGASPGQIRRLILREALSIGAVGIPAGLALGGGGIHLILRLADLVSDNEVFEGIATRYTPATFLFAAAVAGATLVFSALIPALRSGRLTPLDGIRHGGESVSTGITRPGGARGRFAAGLVTLLALRGFRSSRRRVVGTLISLAIPVMLLVAFGGMLKLSREANILEARRHPGLVYSRAGGVPASLVPRLGELSCTEAVYTVFRHETELILPAAALSAGFMRLTDGAAAAGVGDGLVRLSGCRVLCFGDALFDDSFVRSSVDIEARTKTLAGTGVLLVEEGEFRDRKGVKHYLKSLEMDPGERIFVGSMQRPVTVAASLPQPPFDAYNPVEGGVDLIVGELLFRTLSGETGPPETLLILPNREGHDRILGMLEAVRAAEGGEILDAQIAADERTRDYLAVALFFYGFTGMILSIGCMNMAAGIHLNLRQRRREFGLLAAAGMEPLRIERLIVTEAVVLGAAGALAGAIIGTGLWSLLWTVAGSVRGSGFFLPLTQIVLSLILVPLLAAAIALTFARRTVRVPAVDQMRGSGL